MTQLTERPSRTLMLDGETVNVRVGESTRARTLRVILGPRRQLEAIVPHSVSDAELDRFLDEKRAVPRTRLRVRCEQLASANGWAVAERYVDAGISALLAQAAAGG
jgi:predicted metal-dependent hydrolase